MHQYQTETVQKAFIVGIVLNSIFVITEFIAGIWSGSMGLLSDAGHNLGDVFSLILAMIAFRLAKVQATKKYTYGLRKSTILVSLVNAIILLITVGIIIAESIDKLRNPQPVQGMVIMIVAGIGVLINAVTAWLFMKDKEHDLNIKGAFLHLAADALVSVGVVISGIVILYTDFYWIDSVIGLIIACIIVYSTWNLLRSSLRLTLDGVPENIDYDAITKIIIETPYVKGVHHLHIWALSTTVNALTVHVKISDLGEMENIKQQLKERLHKAGIDHVTIEFEDDHCQCSETQFLSPVQS
ncbi:MAG: cation diffusion facilitator family transporter [Bacteroidales bacterium]